MDTDTIGRVKTVLHRIAEQHDTRLEAVIVFGSRARDDYRADSDIDILLVSPDFRTVPYNQRSRHFYLEWPYEELPTPEFITLTPDEFEEKKEEEPHIVHTAVQNGTRIA